MNLKRISKSIGNFFLRYWRKWTILAILAMVIYIGIVVLQYVYKPIYQPKKVEAGGLEIKRGIYRDIMDSYSKSQDIINEVINKNYADPFK